MCILRHIDIKLCSSSLPKYDLRRILSAMPSGTNNCAASFPKPKTDKILVLPKEREFTKCSNCSLFSV